MYGGAAGALGTAGGGLWMCVRSRLAVAAMTMRKFCAFFAFVCFWLWLGVVELILGFGVAFSDLAVL